MRKVDDAKRKKDKIMSFLVATNVVASWPPEPQPTGTPHARAKMCISRITLYVGNNPNTEKQNCLA